MKILSKIDEVKGSTMQRHMFAAALLSVGLAAGDAQGQTGPSTRVALPSLAPGCPDTPLSIEMVRRGQGRNGAPLNVVDIRCMTPDQARMIPLPVLRNLPVSVLACLPVAAAASLPEDVRTTWAQYPTNLGNATALTASETSCLVPGQIARFSEAQWASLSPDAKAVMQIEGNNVIPPSRRNDILAARRISGLYLWSLAIHYDTQEMVWDSARAAYMGAHIDTLAADQHANFVYRIATEILRVINVNADADNPTLLPNQRELLHRMFIGQSRGVESLTVANGVRLPNGQCASGGNCAMGRTEFEELRALAVYAAGELSTLLRNNNAALRPRQNEVNNTIAVLQELDSVLTEARTRTNWDTQNQTIPNAVPPVLDPRAMPSARTETHTVVPPMFWVGVGAAGAGLALGAVGLGLNRAAERTFTENVEACRSFMNMTRQPCDINYINQAEAAASEQNLGAGLAFAGLGLAAVGTTLAILYRPHTVTTTIPAATPSEGGVRTPHPTRPRTDNGVESNTGFSFNASPLPGGAYATISFSAN